ncbi:MAG: ammonium transporter [Caulobacter sp.]
MSTMKKDVVADLAWGVGIVVVALAASFARKQGYIDTDTVNRLVMGAIGLMVAWFGNRMPKRFVPSASARKVSRVGGWSMALSGLVYAGLWAFAPADVAVLGGCGAILAGLAVTIGYCLSLRAKAKAA